MVQPAGSTNLVKVEVTLSPEARYAGFETESLWARPLGDGLFELQSVPFFEYNLNLKDIVRCDESGPLPRFLEVVKRSGQETLRVIFSQSAEPRFLLDTIAFMRERGGVVEPGKNRFYSISFPSWQILHEVATDLKVRDSNQWVSYESGFRGNTR